MMVMMMVFVKELTYQVSIAFKEGRSEFKPQFSHLGTVKTWVIVCFIYIRDPVTQCSEKIN